MTASPTPIRPAATDLPWFSSWWGSLFCCLFSYLSLLYIYSGCEKASLHNGLGRIRSEWSGSPVFFEINHLTNEKEELSCSPKKEVWITLRALYSRQEHPLLLVERKPTPNNSRTHKRVNKCQWKRKHQSIGFSQLMSLMGKRVPTTTNPSSEIGINLLDLIHLISAHVLICSSSLWLEPRVLGSPFIVLALLPPPFLMGYSSFLFSFFYLYS